MTLRIVFMGTPDFAVPTLAAILEAGHEVAAVYSQPPRKAGRGMAVRKSPVNDLADAHGLSVLTVDSFKGADAQGGFAGFSADVAVVAAYGLILPRPVLDAPGHGCLNLHPSLLPRWRGAAPIQRAIMAGDGETGVAIMRMAEGLDTGPVCLVDKTAIGTDETAGALHDRLSVLGADAMVRALEALSKGRLECREQAADGVTYAAKIDKAEARIDWQRPAQELHRHIRGLSPFPGAWFEIARAGKTERVKALGCSLAQGTGAPGEIVEGGHTGDLTVACGDGAVRLASVQRQGRTAMAAQDFLRGSGLRPGARLG